MSEVLILGAGLNGLSAALLLARDGHRVRVLESDAAPPVDPALAWEAWPRPGVNQFHLLHMALPLWRRMAEEDLPELPELLEAAGGQRLNLLAAFGPCTLPWREEDRRFETIAARRPLMEAALAALAQRTEGLEVRRGRRLRGLLLGQAAAGRPRVVGAVDGEGQAWRADLVVDAMGRRSPLPRWLDEAGLEALPEQRAAEGSVYYLRHFRTEQAGPPAWQAGLLQAHHGLSIITLPADHGVRSVAFVARAADQELRRLRDPALWQAAIALYPTAAEWADGEPLAERAGVEAGVGVMAGLHDQARHPVVDGRPSFSGLVLLGDAWACTDPTLGRGQTMGWMHARLLRQALGEVDAAADPVGLVLRFDALTQQLLWPLVQRSWWFHRQRLAEMAADAEGRPFPADGDPDWLQLQAERSMERLDGELARGFAASAFLLQGYEQAFERPGELRTRVMALATGDGPYPLPGPNRGELLRAVSAVRAGHPTPGP